MHIALSKACNQPQQPAAVSLSAVLNKAPAVNVTNVAAPLHPEDVEAAHALLKSQGDFSSVLLLIGRQDHGIPAKKTKTKKSEGDKKINK